MKDYSKTEKDGLEAIRIAQGDKQGPMLLVTLYGKTDNIEKAQKYAALVKKIAATVVVTFRAKGRRHG